MIEWMLVENVEGGSSLRCFKAPVGKRFRQFVQESNELAVWYGTSSGLRACVTFAMHDDGRIWRHASVSLRDQMPTYDDLCLLYNELCNTDRRAVQLFVPASQHISIHPYCLHLWQCEDEDLPLPNFGRFGTI